jgi:uncharacterized protein with HEPN domain
MQAEAKKFAWDALQAVERITRFSANKTFGDYHGDELLRSAIERQFEIVGEALGKLRQVDPQSAATIPDLSRIVAFRNVLVHAYATVDDRLVWGVIETNLSSLQITLGKLLAAPET